jgi:hypothetical protein
MRSGKPLLPPALRLVRISLPVLVHNYLVSENRHAWLGAAGVLLGAMIAAGAGVGGPYLLQAREDRRLDRREAQEARGAARVMFADLVDAEGQMKVLAHDRILRRFDGPKRVVLSQLVAERLDGDTWGRVQQILTNVAALKRFVNARIVSGRHRLTEGQACFVRADLQALGSAKEIVGTKLADGPPDRAPPRPSVDCAAVRPYGDAPS